MLNKNKSKDQNGNSRLVTFNRVSYVFLLVIIASALMLQSCELNDVSNKLDELQNNELDELDREIEESESENEGTDDFFDLVDDQFFTVMDTSLIQNTINFESNYEYLTSIVYVLKNEGDMELDFIDILGNKVVKVLKDGEIYNCFIDFKDSSLEITNGEFKGYYIKIENDILFLYNVDGAYVFEG